MLTPVERVLILKGADLLKEVGPRHLLLLAEVAREIRVAAGDVLYKENDLADALYMMVEGRVRLSVNGRPTSEVGPGEAFGTWALVDDSERGQRAECIEDGMTLALRRDEFYEVAAGDLALLQQVVRVLARRLRSLASRPEEARVEGEGLEEPEAIAEARQELEGVTPATGTTTPGTPVTGPALEAAVLGQPAPDQAAAGAPAPPATHPPEVLPPARTTPAGTEEP